MTPEQNEIRQPNTEASETSPRSPAADDTTKSKSKSLSPKEAQFIEEFVANGGNGTQAYRVVYPRAGYNTARNGAKVILAKPYLQEALKAERRSFLRIHKAKQRRIIEELIKIATAEIGQVFEFTKDGPVLKPINQIPPSARHAIASLEVIPVFPPAIKGKRRKVKPAMRIKLRFHDKIQALDKLSRHLGLYDELPALERTLGELPAKLADQIRQAVREEVEGEAAQRQGAQFTPRSGIYPDADRDVPGDGNAARPVASKIPRELLDEANGSSVSTGGQEFCGSGEDVEPLFE